MDICRLFTDCFFPAPSLNTKYKYSNLPEVLLERAGIYGTLYRYCLSKIEQSINYILYLD